MARYLVLSCFLAGCSFIAVRPTPATSEAGVRSCSTTPIYADLIAAAAAVALGGISAANVDRRDEHPEIEAVQHIIVYGSVATVALLSSGWGAAAHHTCRRRLQ